MRAIRRILVAVKDSGAKRPPAVSKAVQLARALRAEIELFHAMDAPVYIDFAPVCLDYAISSSSDGYATETRVSTQSSNPYVEFSGSFIGDYTGVAVDATGAAYTVWTDDRGLPGKTTPNQDTLVGKKF